MTTKDERKTWDCDQPQMPKDVVIQGRLVTAGHPPLIVAEMSGNHAQSLDRALALVDAAADAGAHALKLQTYTADTLTLDVERDEFRITDPTSPWAGRTLYSLYTEASTPWEWHAAIFERARQRGMIAFSTPFDESAVDFLETLEVPCYKIASFEIIHLPLIRKVAATGKPILISTGMASLEEIDAAVRTATEGGCGGLILLRCTSNYPAAPDDIHLSSLSDLRGRFGCHVGLSDHTLGTAVAVAAVSLGAVVIEKHFTMRRADGGVDAVFSLEPHELETLVRDTAMAFRALGSVHYGATDSERPSLALRPSLYVAKDVRAGDVFTAQNLRVVRPGLGLLPKHYNGVLGRRVVIDAPKGTPVSWDLLADDGAGSAE